MAKGYKTGGRQAGTPNKRTAEVTERLAALGCDPIEGLARIALDETNAIEIRLRAYSELAPYAEPKRKSIEARIEGAHSVQINVIDSYADHLRRIDEKVIDQGENVVPLVNARLQ